MELSFFKTLEWIVVLFEISMLIVMVAYRVSKCTYYEISFISS